MTQHRKALLVGSSFSAAPIYHELKKHGLHVTVCGDVKQDPCHQYADSSVYADYSDKEQLLQVVEAGDFDYLVPTCNDYSYLSASWVADKLSLPGFDTPQVTQTLHSKKVFRQFTHDNQLRAPELYQGHSVDSLLNYPCLVKPVDAFSGRGVTKVHNHNELGTAVAIAEESSRGGACVIEQYVEGTLHSHSAFVSDGRIVADFFVDEFCTTYPYQVNCSNHPSGLSNQIKNGVQEELRRLISILALSDGLLHSQFISDGDNFWIIECMRRCPGDLYGQLIERSTGINYTGMYVAPFLRKKYPESSVSTRSLPYGRHTVSTSDNLIYFSFTHAIPTIDVEIVQLKTSGEILAAAPNDKLAILIFPYKDNEHMLNLTPGLAGFIAITSSGELP